MVTCFYPGTKMAEAAEPGSGFNSKSVALRAQKKLLGKMASKNMAKAFVDDTTGDLLDQLYRLAKLEIGNKKEAEKLVKDLVKIVVKISILFRNDQLNREEIQVAEAFRRNFRSAAMTLISFYEVDFSFDKKFLTKNLEDCRALLHRIIERHLTAKSHGRVDHVFDYYANGDMLEKVFLANRDGPYGTILKNIVDNLNKLMEEGNL